MGKDRTPEPGNYRDFGGDDSSAGIDSAVGFALAWLFLLGPLIGFAVGIATTNWWLTVWIWFGGVILASIVGYAFGK